jgi:glycosidase
MMEFHIARAARERYQFSQSLFSFSGNVVFGSLAAAREFAHRISLVRGAEAHPDLAVHAGQLYAMGLIDEASHALIARYREQFDPELFTAALEEFRQREGEAAVDKLLLSFVEQFPGSSVLSGEETPKEWLAESTSGRPHTEVVLEELLLLWLANRNPAFEPFAELFDDAPLAESTVYREVAAQLPAYFATRPLIRREGAEPIDLLALLTAPAAAAPTSLKEQLDLLRQLWRPLLGDSLDKFFLVAGEILHEESVAIWMQFNPPAVQAREAAEQAARERQRTGRNRDGQYWPALESRAEVPSYAEATHEYEKFSPDTAWMPEAVMIAKSTYVWLSQLSKQYGREIARLDEIPDDALATLAARGINTLWLIGVWERSRASRSIKLLCGNADAAASAYSLFDYRIADSLGGDAAYTRLRDRAFHHGIRLASDMVPNHMGIDSPWVVEHTDWFMSRPDSPYPAYSFNGPDLSADSRVEIKIDDKYYTQSDAAVVFRRRDNATGETRYIYHGNDGTSFPWNDTAQLDYMNPAVREHVIQTILHVARLFPVIRFDAAMTLAKRHFHRLWFPGPGASGAIPSRAEYGMTQAEFDAAMPHEFWREVVDRVAAEVPGTLLLAEAFWLMEGYFVRTLGMHRVYNSAFMVMLRDEDNANYRSVLKKTIEFDPDILKRYVNFISNPDERTAIDQFGKGDKCFGVAALMATLPGLPMFGHGQIEGFTEKYGMEYRTPRMDEKPDPWLIERHQRQIAPLLKMRWLFAESANFLLYDFERAADANSTTVDENVFAYSNCAGHSRALVVYNNAYAPTRGTIRTSVLHADKASGELASRLLWQGLGFTREQAAGGAILAWRDSLTGLEYLCRTSKFAVRGLTLELRGYESRVLLDWRLLHPTEERPWDKLSDQLAGRGVPHLEDALADLELRLVHTALRLAFDPAFVHQLAELATETEEKREESGFFLSAWDRCEAFLREAEAFVSAFVPQPASLHALLRAALRIPALESGPPAPFSASWHRVLPAAGSPPALWGPVLAWCLIQAAAKAVSGEDSAQTAAQKAAKPALGSDRNPASDGERAKAALNLYDRLRLREPLAQAFQAIGIVGEDAWKAAARIKVLLLAELEKSKPEKNEPEKSQSAAGEPATGKAESAAGKAEPAERKAKSEQAGASDESASPAEPVSLVEPVSFAEPVSLWQDPDLRWLTGVHAWEGSEYFLREPFEDLLWFRELPALIEAAGEKAPDLSAIAERVAASLAAAEAAGYRIDKLTATELPEPEGEPEREPENEQGSELESHPATDATEPETTELAAEPEPAPIPVNVASEAQEADSSLKEKELSE